MCPLFQAAAVGVKRAANLLFIVYQAILWRPSRGLVFIVMVPEEDWVNGVAKSETVQILE